jgi:hypothetical protein
MIEIAVISSKNKEMIGELTKAAQRFRGKSVKVMIPEANENELERRRTS